jgi:hypothetical protein
MTEGSKEVAMKIVTRLTLLLVAALAGCALSSGGDSVPDAKAICDASGGKWRPAVRQCDRWGD